jgi:hypothetical protein
VAQAIEVLAFCDRPNAAKPRPPKPTSRKKNALGNLFLGRYPTTYIRLRPKSAQRSPGVKVKLTLEIEAEAPSGFNDGDVGVVRDNTKQLKFSPGSTGFSD